MKFIFICSFVLITFGLNNAHAELIKLTTNQQKNMGITVTKIQKATMGQARRYSAEVLIPPAQERLVSAPQPGLIEAMYVAVGDSVKQGQLLARVTSPDLVMMQSDYLQAKTHYQLAQKSLARDEALFKEGIIPERRYLETKSQLQLTSAQLAQTKQSMKLAGIGDGAINKMTSAQGMQSSIAMNAPISGQVLEQMVSVGQRVDAAMPIYRIAQLDTLWLELSVPVQELQHVQVGAEVNVNNKQVKAEVVTIMRSVNKQNQTTKVRAKVKYGADLLSPGELVQAEVTMQNFGQSKDIVFRVPKSALARYGQQVAVFKQLAQGFDAVTVNVMSEQDAYALVKGQLTSQDTIAITGIIALKGAALGMGAE